MSQDRNHPSKAEEVYQVLRLAAEEHQCRTYGQIAEAVGLANRGVSIPLYFLWGFCKGRGIPHISAIAVNKKSQTPGQGYPLTESEWTAMKKLVFDFPWPKHLLDKEEANSMA